MDAKRSRFPVDPITIAIISLIVTGIVGLATIVGVIVSVNTYNSRYDADAEASGGLEYTFKENGKDYAAGSFTASAGKISYGYFQKSGGLNTQYSLYYKKSTNSSYTFLKNFTIYSLNDYTGEFDMTSSTKTQKYDLKLERKSNRSKPQVVEIDWGIA